MLLRKAEPSNELSGNPPTLVGGLPESLVERSVFLYYMYSGLGTGKLPGIVRGPRQKTFFVRAATIQGGRVSEL